MRDIRRFFRVIFLCWFMRQSPQPWRALSKAEVKGWTDWIFAQRSAPIRKGDVMKELRSLARLAWLCIVLAPPFYGLLGRGRLKSQAQALALANWAMEPLKGAA